MKIKKVITFQISAKRRYEIYTYKYTIYLCYITDCSYLPFAKDSKEVWHSTFLIFIKAVPLKKNKAALRTLLKCNSFKSPQTQNMPQKERLL